MRQPAVRDLLGEPLVELLDAVERAATAGVELLAPAGELPLQVPLRPAEVAEADFPGVEVVEVGEDVDQAAGERIGALRAEPPGLLRSAVRYTVPCTSAMT